jgi:hypothetical protein
VGYVARTGEMRSPYSIKGGKCEGNDHLGDVNVDEKKVLRWILKNLGVNMRNGFTCIRKESSSG